MTIWVRLDGIGMGRFGTRAFAGFAFYGGEHKVPRLVLTALRAAWSGARDDRVVKME
jgi:hypothetical protein